MASAVSASLALPLAAQAGDFDYDYVQGNYFSINDPSSSGLSSDHAFGVEGSWALPSDLVALGSYAHETADTTFAGQGVSGNFYAVGLGYRLSLSDKWDLVPSLSYDSQHASTSGPLVNNSLTFNGYDLMLKARGMLTDELELDPGYDFSRVSGGGNTLTTNTLFVHGFYHFTPNLAVGLGYENAANGGTATNTWKFMFRYSFR